MGQNRLHSSIIITHRCNSRCTMCNIWKHQSDRSDEIKPQDLERLPKTFFTNVGGGESFLRDDLDEVVGVLRPKTRRMVVSTNGQLTDRIVRFAERFPHIGIRISIDGLPEAHDHLRGIPGSCGRALRTLLALVEMGHPDTGFAMTLQDRNLTDLLPLFRLACSLGVEFATGLVQNAFYFKTTANRIVRREEMARELDALAARQLSSWRPKDWFRAYYNAGLAERARGRLQPRRCAMGSEAGFVTDPTGDVLPCNSHDQSLPLGNLRHQTWEEIWNGPRAAEVRRRVTSCEKQCWAIGDVAPEIWRHPWRPISWVAHAWLRMKLVGPGR